MYRVVHPPSEEIARTPKEFDKGDPLMRGLFRSVVVLTILLSSVSLIATAQDSDKKTVGKQSQNTDFLLGLSGIQEWASKLEQALKSQGKEIDQRKAKSQLLPKVTAIQKSLSGLEDINRKIVEDAGSQPKDLKRDKMAQDLSSLEAEIRNIENTFSDLREEVQLISLPEMTDVERLGESIVMTRSVEIYRTLRILGYEDDGTYRNQGSLVDYQSLKASSDKITTLLHQAQDAFGKLHTYLAS